MNTPAATVRTTDQVVADHGAAMSENWAAKVACTITGEQFLARRAELEAAYKVDYQAARYAAQAPAQKRCRDCNQPMRGYPGIVCEDCR